MPLTPQDVQNASADMQHLEELLTSSAPTSTDRLGHVKKTWAKIMEDLDSEVLETVTGQNAANAAEAADASLTALAGANAARDQAVTGAGIKVSVDQGIATTTTDQFFSVPAGDGRTLIVYRNAGGGSAVEVMRQTDARAMNSFYDVNAAGKTRITPEALSLSDTPLGWWDIATAYMFQDRFGSTPVTAIGQNVGLIVPRNGKPGADVIPAASATFSSATGWTVPAGWAINTGTGEAVATAATGALRWITTLLASRHYATVIEVSDSAGGTLTVSLGAGTAIDITANKRYVLYPLVGGAPTGGMNITATGWTGKVKFAQLALAPVWNLYAPTDAERGTYQLNSYGPYVDLPAGTRMKTDSIHAFALPAYACLALGRGTPTTFTMASFGAGTMSLSFVDASTTAYRMNIGSSRSGVFSQPGTRSGMFPLDVPLVADCYVEPGFTSSYPNGGERDVHEAAGLASGAKRKLPNTFIVGDTVANASFGLNYNNGSAVAANTRFYGGCCSSGLTISLQQRRKILDYFMTAVTLDTLKEQEYDIFLFIGQSNMMGVGNQATSPVVPITTGAEYVDSGYLRPLKDPTQHSVPANMALTGSLLPAFANRYFALTGRKVCVVGSAYSGEGLVVGAIAGGTWLGPKLVSWAAFKLKNALKDVKGQFRGVLNLGGEQDVTHVHTQSQYEGYIVQLRDKLRAALGIPDAQLYQISIDDNATSGAAYALIRAAQAAATANEGIHLAVPFQNHLAAGRLSDGIHRNQTALDMDGTAAADYIAPLLTQ